MSSRTPSSGIVSFAAVLFTLVGFLNAIHGMAAIFKKEYFDESSLLYENLQVWGWIWLVLGILQIGAAYLIVGRAASGRTLGIFLAGASVIISFASLGAHPLGSTLIIALDVLIIWGLTTRAELFVPGGIADDPRAPRPEPSGRPYA
jgi:hypothetical protein